MKTQRSSKRSVPDCFCFWPPSRPSLERGELGGQRRASGTSAGGKPLMLSPVFNRSLLSVQNQASHRRVGAELLSKKCIQGPGALSGEPRPPALNATIGHGHSLSALLKVAYGPRVQLRYVNKKSLRFAKFFEVDNLLCRIGLNEALMASNNDTYYHRFTGEKL